MSFADREPLPHELGRYRPRWEQAPRGAPDGAPARMVARDTVLGKDLDLVRVVFGAERRAERDAAVSRLRARTTVLAPALVAVHDAGDWDQDAFVLLEPVEAPSPLGEAIRELAPALVERLRWAVALADAALVLDRAELAISPDDWAAAVVDAYRTPRVVGLERASPVTEASRRESVRALGSLLGTVAAGADPRVSPGGGEPGRGSDVEALRGLQDVVTRCADGTITIPEIRARLAALVGAPEEERPLLPNVDAEHLRRRETGLLVAGLGLFLLSFVVLIVVLASSR